MARRFMNCSQIRIFWLHRWRHQLYQACLGTACLLAAAANVGMAVAQDAVDRGAVDRGAVDRGAVDRGAGEPQRPAVLIPVQLPVTQAVADETRQALEQTLANAQTTAHEDQRTVVILEFDTSDSKTGRGSSFHACLSLGELLTDLRMNRLHTVAFIPGPKGLASDGDALGAQPVSALKGHAVLVALACNEIAMHTDSSIGEAGIDESTVSRTRLVAYEELARKRSNFHLAIVRSFIDKDVALFRTEAGNTIDYVDRAGLDESQVDSYLTLNDEGTLALLSSEVLDRYRLIEYRVDSRRQLARQLNINADDLQLDPLAQEDARAILVNIDGFLDQKSVNWLIRSINQQPGRFNLIVAQFNAYGGDPSECMRLAEYFSSFNPAETRVVAFIDQQASGAPALIALACHELLMSPDATLGGAVEPPLQPEELKDLKRGMQRIAKRLERRWSLAMAFVDPQLELVRARNANSVELMARQELDSLDDNQAWNVVATLNVTDGIDGSQAVSLGIAKMLINNMDQLKAYYQLEDNLVSLEPTLADRWIGALSSTLASPWVAAWLLFGAMFLLSTEMSQPGLGIPGFLGTMCLLLFFWSQYLDGNVHWLEILLFISGAVFIAIEILVLPGFGVFGIGGLVMLVVSIVLATQTFVFPRSSEDFARLPVSLSMVLAACAGFFVALAFFGKYLPKTPYFKRLILSTDEEDSLPSHRMQREATAHRDHLLGKTGAAFTRLAPSGKARIGDEIVDVISVTPIVEKNEAIEVVEVSGNRVVVRAVEGPN